MVDATQSLEYMFNSCLIAMEEKGASLEACLAPYPFQQNELEPLLRLVLRLREARDIHPRPEFLDAAPQRMQNLIAVRPHRKTASPQATAQPNHWHMGLRLQALLGLLLLVVLLAVGGAFAASAQALPGDPLYSMKRVGEDLHLALTRNPAEQARLHMSYADQRMEEALQLSQDKRMVNLPEALQDYTQEVRAEQFFLAETSPLTAADRAKFATQLSDDLQKHAGRLQALELVTPAITQKILQTALDANRAALERARQFDDPSPGGLLPSLISPMANKDPEVQRSTSGNGPAIVAGQPPKQVPPLIVPPLNRVSWPSSRLHLNWGNVRSREDWRLKLTTWNFSSNNARTGNWMGKPGKSYGLLGKLLVSGTNPSIPWGNSHGFKFSPSKNTDKSHPARDAAKNAGHAKGGHSGPH